MSRHVELQEAVVAALNEANLEFPIEAQTSDEAYYDLPELTGSLKVNVVRGSRSVVPMSRSHSQRDFNLHVGVMKRWLGLTDAQLETKFQELDAFIDQMLEYLRAQRYGNAKASPLSFEIVAPYSTDHRERLRQFTAEFIITLRTIE